MFFNMKKNIFNETIMVIDVGNTNTVFALVNKNGIFHKWRMSTILHRTADEYETHLNAFISKINNLNRCYYYLYCLIPSYVVEHYRKNIRIEMQP